MLDDRLRERVRLHITPLNEDIYNRIIPPSLAESVANVSLHAVQTFPERGFGYVDMPRAEADKLKQKLNGSTLKGTKIRIEEARPEKKRKSDVADVEDEAVTKRHKAGGEKKAKKLKQSKVQGVVAGHELEDGRHVKRAWTDPSSKDKRTRAEKSASDRKLLFRTTLPPSATPLAGSTAKDKPSKKVTKEEAKRKRSGDKRTTVEEFAHHRKSFALGQTQLADIKPAVQYIDGEGWVDEDGKVVEAAPRSTRARTLQYTGAVQPATGSEVQPSPPVDGIADATSARTSPSAEDGDENGTGQPESDDADVDSATQKRRQPGEPPAQSQSQSHATAHTPPQEASDKGDDDDDSTDTAEPDDLDDEPAKPRKVHPLEALYKKKTVSDTNGPRLNLAPIDTSFSFFGSNTNDEEDQPSQGIKELNSQTPHTKQEFEWRAQRSAAPTPDTAAIDGRFGFPFGSDYDDDDNDDNDDDHEDDEGEEEDGHDVRQQPGTASGQATKDSSSRPQQEESAFRKYFYEHRGENDRAWKRKRREAKKQERQRENRRLGRRVV